ncbi:SAM-dependent DNA methyltransferase [Egibacter rhizosphaerae]|uniref:site-specific DNA-methyltransferase (adenine-specific) n=1 Tax=Egibacter rhizosphaerae TaxID=1670831 RepID=A0A411YLH9_9ACTN|nr:SAM-dependent DNA methyltransferase [Egibacter rhizosphaerae]
MNNHAAFIWSVADLLRGDYKQSEYGRVILPMVVLRRLDCVLEPTKQQVLARAEQLSGKVENTEPLLRQAAGERFFNTSKLTLPKLLDDPTNIADQLHAYLLGFSPAAKDVLEKFDLPGHIDRLDRADLLYLVVSRFCDIDLHPERVSNLEMGYLYEELIRRFSELSNETAGEHFTPREVIRLMVNLLFSEDDAALSRPGVVSTLFDPACGTGGMLSVAEDHLRHLNPEAHLEAYGQELNAETYAICRSDMMLKGQDASRIQLGNSFSDDAFGGLAFDYMLANPPFGVEWKKVEKPIKDEAESKGFAGRFGAGLPRINDGSFLFLQHMISKMKPPEQGGSRLAIVFNGSPLFTGSAGSGESEIRRWIIESDWLEAVIALPDQLFYNTGISTYFWVVTNRKRPERRGKVQLIDARDYWTKMRKSLGEKRKELSPDHIADITRIYGDFEEGEHSKILPNEALGFLRITVERPLRLRWEVTEHTLAALRAAKPLAKLDPNILDDLAGALANHTGLTSTDRADLEPAVTPVISAAGLTKPQTKAVWDALAVRDPHAPVITNRKGDPEPDPELRDQENVALPQRPVRYEADPTARLDTIEHRTAIDNHLETEIRPYVPDAWIDHTKTKIGYEIPLTRHFYKYQPPRPLDEIDTEIRQLEAEIQQLLNEVTE